jgi:arsenate reductase
MNSGGIFDFDDLDGVLSRVSDRIDDAFKGVFSKETIARYVNESYELLAKDAKVFVHLPALSERFAKDRLRALAINQELISNEQPRILFVCVHNAGRSQMAAGFAMQLGGERVSVLSAGSAPSDSIPENVKAAMADKGVSLDDFFPKPLTDEVVRAADVVITMGCGDACPIYPGKRYLDWELEDPSELDLAGTLAVRDEILSRVTNLLNEMGITQ